MIAEELRRELRRAAAAPVLLVGCDYDGVLSPLVSDPAAAVPDAQALANLVTIGGLVDTHALIVSGRSRSALRALVGDPDGLILVGTHGAEEPGAEFDPQLRSQVANLTAQLTRVADRYPGALVEAKPIGAAFHYRNALDRAGALGEARTVAERFGGRSIEGKMVVEVMLVDANKGHAIEAARARLEADATAFLGDDTTDEDVFAILGAFDVGIKVGPETTRARFRVDGQSDVAEVLGILAEERGSAVVNRAGGEPPAPRSKSNLVD